MSSQRWALDLGRWGCYALSLTHLLDLVQRRERSMAERVGLIEEWVRRGWIIYSASSSFFVASPASCLEHGDPGYKWTVEVRGKDRPPRWTDGEWAIGCWTRGVDTHFLLAFEGGKWLDPMGDDWARRNGYSLTSWRIFRRRPQ